MNRAEQRAISRVWNKAGCFTGRLPPTRRSTGFEDRGVSKEHRGFYKDMQKMRSATRIHIFSPLPTPTISMIYRVLLFGVRVRGDTTSKYQGRFGKGRERAQRCVGLASSSLLVHFLVVTCSMLYCKHVASFGSRSTVQQYKVQVINNTWFSPIQQS